MHGIPKDQISELNPERTVSFFGYNLTARSREKIIGLMSGMADIDDADLARQQEALTNQILKEKFTVNDLQTHTALVCEQKRRKSGIIVSFFNMITGNCD